MKHSVMVVLALGLFCLYAMPCANAGEGPEIKDGNPRVLMKTSAGDIELELFEDAAPNTVANFITLIEKKFYDGVLFHRIIANFMIQGGDPQGNGTGGPGYTIPDELTNNKNKHNQYALSMAKTQAPDSGGSQFFIVTNKQGTPHLDGVHTVFGKVTKGFEAVDKLGVTHPGPDVKMISVTVLQKQKHEYTVKKSN